MSEIITLKDISEIPDASNKPLVQVISEPEKIKIISDDERIKIYLREKDYYVYNV